MARYLVVAHRTAKSPELAAKLKELLAQDPEARFVLLVPAVPPPGWVYEENEVRRRAEEEAAAAKRALGPRASPWRRPRRGTSPPPRHRGGAPRPPRGLPGHRPLHPAPGAFPVA